MYKEEALLETKKQWIWLRDNPGRSKIDYFTENNIKYVPRGACYLCQYVRDTFGVCAGACPIQWTEDGRFCISTGSPFLAWNRARTKDAKAFHAQEMVNLVDAALKGRINL